MMSKEELPELPDGWQWMEYADGEGHYASGECADVGIYGDGLDITLIGKIAGVTNHGAAAIDSSIPLSVLSAVLKANGVEL